MARSALRLAALVAVLAVAYAQGGYL